MAQISSPQRPSLAELLGAAQARSGQVRSGQVKADQAKTGQLGQNNQAKQPAAPQNRVNEGGFEPLTLRQAPKTSVRQPQSPAIQTQNAPAPNGAVQNSAVQNRATIQNTSPLTENATRPIARSTAAPTAPQIGLGRETQAQQTLSVRDSDGLFAPRQAARPHPANASSAPNASPNASSAPNAASAPARPPYPGTSRAAAPLAAPQNTPSPATARPSVAAAQGVNAASATHNAPVRGAAPVQASAASQGANKQGFTLQTLSALAGVIMGQVEQVNQSAALGAVSGENIQVSEAAPAAPLATHDEAGRPLRPGSHIDIKI